MRFLPLIFIFLFGSCSDKDKKVKNIEDKYYSTDSMHLQKSMQTINLEYISWACACANWATPDDINKYSKIGELSTHSIFIEPASEDLGLPDTLGYSADLIKFTGQFYKEKGYPKKYLITEEQVNSAKVFRYIKYEVLKSNYKSYIDTGNIRKL